MGVTIHYRGTLDDPKRVGDLQRELADIAESVGWKWRTLDDDWAVPPSASLIYADGHATINGHLGLKGIDLIPDGKSEPVSFLFDATGHLRSIMGMILIGELASPRFTDLADLSAEGIASRIEDFLRKTQIGGKRNGDTPKGGRDKRRTGPRRPRR